MKPIIVTQQRTFPMDVDDCLVMHEWPESSQAKGAFVRVQDPLVLEPAIILLRVNESMVKILKDEKTRGAFTMVWSKSGTEWAAAIVYALNLEKYVDIVLGKPTSYGDDKDAKDWMPDRVYVGPDTTYKKANQ